MVLLRVKLGFVQLIRKASLIFKSNLELALSITLKERELPHWASICSWNIRGTFP